MIYHYLIQLPDFDFDIGTETSIPLKSRLSTDDGQQTHSVARSTIDLPWELTKMSCDRLGIPHVDLLPNSLLDSLTLYDMEEIEDPRLFQLLSWASKKIQLYHIHRWMEWIEQCKPTTLEELAWIIAAIRPNIRELIEQGLQLKIVTLGRVKEFIEQCDGYIVWQDQMIELLSYIYDCPLEHAEYIRSSRKEDLLRGIDDPITITQQEFHLINAVYRKTNKHLMAKGHCLQVAYIVMCQVRQEVERAAH